MCGKNSCPCCEITATCITCGQFVCDGCYGEHQSNYEDDNIPEPCCGDTDKKEMTDNNDDTYDSNETVEYDVNGADDWRNVVHRIKYL